jgi:hypothetical protein
MPPSNAKEPRYFHLLWDEEIERLRDILQVLRECHAKVLDRWYQLYTIHFGEAATLSRHEFYTLYHPPHTGRSEISDVHARIEQRVAAARWCARSSSIIPHRRAVMAEMANITHLIELVYESWRRVDHTLNEVRERFVKATPGVWRVHGTEVYADIVDADDPTRLSREHVCAASSEEMAQRIAAQHEMLRLLLHQCGKLP